MKSIENMSENLALLFKLPFWKALCCVGLTIMFPIWAISILSMAVLGPLGIFVCIFCWLWQISGQIEEFEKRPQEKDNDY